MIWIIYSLLLMMALSIGSFLNVVIYRGPVIWGLVDEPETGGELSLAWPPSHCPACKTPVRLIHLLPVIGYLLLRGKCRDCGATISPRYPLVEVLTGLAAVLTLMVWGVSLTALAVFVFLTFLIALSAIDREHTYLPDALTLPLIVLGLGVNSIGLLTPFREAVIGAVAGYGVFWLVGFVYHRLRGADGLGLGDAKLLAALGAWLGWMALPFVVLIGSVAGLAGIAVMKLSGQPVRHDTAIPLGPYLATGGAAVLLLAGAGYLGI